ncbi:hypothetical protein ILUMI_09252 [Ignelater luminosus]|uniref:Lipase n=1 Tax=Ignelater luminosus TaxID=2038154 RepID=A0A8K0GCL8_IGNLU|nr:hypothetical protein ILUMI_09252 [Ignelater luminosus]
MFVKIFLFVFSGSIVYSLFKIHPDFGLNAKQLIENYRYPFENHTVTTEDGYILELHRIPHGKGEVNCHNITGPPVLIVPGTHSTSADWVNMGKNSLGFILADRGYDVWLANYRGTTWSRKHIRLDPDVHKKEFWDYSFQDIGSYDLPAFIDYILRVTKHERLFYIGHSQGTLSFFILTSDKPEYNAKIRLMVALGPVAYFNNARSLIIRFLAAFENEVQAFVDKYQFYEILPYTSLMRMVAQTFCNDYSLFQSICTFAFYILAGYSPNQFNKTMIPVILSNSPASSSFKHWRHAAQMRLADTMLKYNYGTEENLKRYSQSTPPEYNLTKITTPVAFYYGEYDLFCSKEDVDMAAAKIPNVLVNKCIPEFNHVDLLWGVDVVKLIFSEILDLMMQY